MVIGFRSAYCETAHLARQDARAYRRVWSSRMLRCSAQPSPRAAGRAIAGTRKFGVVLSMRRDRLGHGPSGDIADRYTHAHDEMIKELLAGQTQWCQAAVAAQARIDEASGAEPCSAKPAPPQWLGGHARNPAPISAPITCCQNTAKPLLTSANTPGA